MGRLRQRQVEREVERRMASVAPAPLQTAETERFMAAVEPSGEIEIERGDTKFLNGTVTNADGSPFDLTGCFLWHTAKVNIEDADADAVYQRTSGADAGITVTNAAQGAYRVHIRPADTANLAADLTLVWDVQVRTPENHVYTVTEGTLSVSRDITRAT